MELLWALLVHLWLPTYTWNTLRSWLLVLSSPFQSRNERDDVDGVDDVFSIVPKEKQEGLLRYLNSIDPHIKFTVEQPNSEGAIPFIDTLPKPNGNEISVSVYRKPTHTDRYLDFNPAIPSQQRAVVRALMDRAENVCSDPVILAKEMEHLNKVLMV